MRSLAEYTMRGERQASLVILVSMIIPMLYWLGAAFVALRILRKGFRNSLNVILAGAIVALFWLLQGNPMASITLAGSVVLAAALRHTASWRVLLILLVPAGLVISLVVETFYQTLFSQAVMATRKLHPETVTYFVKGSTAMTSVQINDMLSLFLVKAYVFCALAGILLSLVIARYWQALLYNPGGFREEMNALRLPFPVAILLMCLWWVVAYIPVNMIKAASPGLVLPFLFAGLALVHGLLAISQVRQKLALLTITYLILLIFYPLIIVLAFFDSFADFRGRLSTRNKLGGQ